MARSDGQMIMTVSIDERLVEEVDKARGFKPRAHFVREALLEHLKTLGYELPPHIVAPPDRAGKGGRKKPVKTNRGSIVLLVEESAVYKANAKKP